MQERHFLFLLTPEIAAGTLLMYCTSTSCVALYTFAGIPWVDGVSSAYGTQLCGWCPGYEGHLHGSSIGLIHLTRCMHGLMAAKKIFSGVARIISPQFHSRKIPSLGGLRTDPDAFPSRSLHQVHCRNATSFPFFSTSSYNSNVCLCLVFVLPDSPLLSINGFLFGVVRLACIKKSLFAVEFLTQPSSQKSIRLISVALVPLIAISSGLGHN